MNLNSLTDGIAADFKTPHSHVHVHAYANKLLSEVRSVGVF